MKIQEIILCICFFLLSGYVYSQESEDAEQIQWTWDWERDTLVVTDTISDTIYISTLDDVTREFGMTFDEYVHRFLTVKDEQDSTGRLSSNRIYLNYFLPLLKSEFDFISKRLVYREYRIAQSEYKTGLTLTELPVNYYESLDGLSLDIMMTCYGKKNTDMFLQSPYELQTAVEELFKSIYASRNQHINGINVCFPDYSFNENRKMAQFIKSISLITDSSRIESIRDLKLYITFDRREGQKHLDFLCCLTQMADSVFLLELDNEVNTFPIVDVIDYSQAKELLFHQKVKNQIYLARHYTKDFPETNSDRFLLSDIRNLMYSDYHDNQWEIYFYVLIGIFILILGLILLYLFFSPFADWINRNMDYVYALLIMIVLEIYLLAFTMFESMSKDNIFTFGDKDRNVILWMPLLFIFILPMMKSIRNKRYLP